MRHPDVKRIEPGRLAIEALRTVERQPHGIIESHRHDLRKIADAADSRTTTSLYKPLISGCASFAGTGVIRCTQYDESVGEKNGTTTIRRFKPRIAA